MERMQSTYENLVEFNLSESGVRPLTPRELIADATGCDGLLDQPLVYSQSNGTIELRQAIAADVSGRGRRSHRSHQRRLGSKLHHDLQPDRAGRRSGDARPELHADMGPVAGVWRHDPRVAPRRGSRGRTMARRRRRARAAGHAANEDDRHLQSQQSHRSAPDACRSRCDCARRRQARRVDPVGRGVSRRGDRRRGNRVDVGPVGEGDHHERTVEGLRASGPAHRLDRRTTAAHRVALVVPRLRDHRARRPERSPGPNRAEAGAPRAVVRADTKHPQRESAADGGLAHGRRRLPLDQAGSRRDHLCALRPPREFDDARESIARGEERPDRAGRSLRHGRLPAARLRRAARVQPRRPRSTARSTGVNPC